LTTIFSIADPDSTGATFLEAYSDQTCGNKKTDISINSNVLTLDMATAREAGSAAANFYFKFGVDVASAECISNLVTIKVLPCTFSGTGVGTT
jgi:hypothetical protein